MSLFVSRPFSLPTEQQLHVVCVIGQLNADVHSYAHNVMVVNIHDGQSEN